MYTVHCILDTSVFPIFCGQDYFGQNIVKIARIYLVFINFYYYWHFFFFYELFLLYYDQNNHDRKKIGMRKYLLYLQILRGGRKNTNFFFMFFSQFFPVFPLFVSVCLFLFFFRFVPFSLSIFSFKKSCAIS